MGQRRLGAGKLSATSSRKEEAEKKFFRRQTMLLNEILRSDLHYLPSYERTSIPGSRHRHSVTTASSSSLTKTATPTSSTSPAALFHSRAQPHRAAHRATNTPEPQEILSARSNLLVKTRSHHRLSHCDVLGPLSCQQCTRVLSQLTTHSSRLPDHAPLHSLEDMGQEHNVDDSETCPMCRAQKRGSATPSVSIRTRRQSVTLGIYSPHQVFMRVMNKVPDHSSERTSKSKKTKDGRTFSIPWNDLDVDNVKDGRTERSLRSEHRRSATTAKSLSTPESKILDMSTGTDDSAENYDFKVMVTYC